MHHTSICNLELLFVYHQRFGKRFISFAFRCLVHLLPLTHFKYSLFNRCIFFRWPFEWRHPFGYLSIFIYEFIIIYYAIMFCAVFVCFPFGTCHFMTTFANDIKMELISLNELIEENEGELLEKLFSIIEFHAIAKR